MPPEVISLLIRFIVVVISLSVLLALTHWKRLPGAFQFLTLYLGWNLVVECIIFFLPPNTNNLPLLHVHTLLEFVLISLVYWKMDIFRNWPPRSFWIFMATISGVIVLNSVFLQSIFTYNSYAKSLVQVLLIGYAVGYIFQLKEKSHESRALNMMNAAVLIFYSGSLFVFMFGNVMLELEYEVSSLFWSLNVFLNVLFQVLILISLWKVSRVRKSLF